MRLPIKPFSTNGAWITTRRGTRIKSKAYRKYIADILLLLRPMKIPETPLDLTITWGFSSKGSDIDNPAKPFIDCLQKKYGFNDNRIYKLTLLREQVDKGAEFIDFEIRQLESNMVN